MTLLDIVTVVAIIAGVVLLTGILTLEFTDKGLKAEWRRVKREQQENIIQRQRRRITEEQVLEAVHLRGGPDNLIEEHINHLNKILKGVGSVKRIKKSKTDYEEKKNKLNI